MLDFDLGPLKKFVSCSEFWKSVDDLLIKSSIAKMSFNSLSFLLVSICFISFYCAFSFLIIARFNSSSFFKFSSYFPYLPCLLSSAFIRNFLTIWLLRLLLVFICWRFKTKGSFLSFRTLLLNLCNYVNILL